MSPPTVFALIGGLCMSLVSLPPMITSLRTGINTMSFGSLILLFIGQFARFLYGYVLGIWSVIILDGLGSLVTIGALRSHRRQKQEK